MNNIDFANIAAVINKIMDFITKPAITNITDI